MDAVEVLRQEGRRAYSWLDANVSTLTPEQALWQPPGTANSIAATYAHAVIAADVDLHLRFHGRKPLIADKWGERLGLTMDFPDSWHTETPIDWNLLHEYGREVQARVIRLVNDLTPSDLERAFDMKAFLPGEPGAALASRSLGTWQGFDVYTLHCGGHIWMHGGEIAALKGLQGLQGYADFRFL